MCGFIHMRSDQPRNDIPDRIAIYATPREPPYVPNPSLERHAMLLLSNRYTGSALRFWNISGTCTVKGREIGGFGGS